MDEIIIPRGYTEEKIAKAAYDYMTEELRGKWSRAEEEQAARAALQEAQKNWRRVLQMLENPTQSNKESLQKELHDTQMRRDELSAVINELMEVINRELKPAFNAEVKIEADKLASREILAYRESKANRGGSHAEIEELREAVEELQGQIDELESTVSELASRLGELE